MSGETAGVRSTEASPAAALVSVTVPTYNHAAFIADCLDSILEQDYPAIEIVVADDRSEDSTTSIVEKYAVRYPDVIRVLSSDVRLGITLNANRAWLASSGKYVSTMAGDDLMRPGKLSRQVQLMEADDTCSLCYHDLEVFDSQTGETLYRWNQVRGHPPLEGTAENIIIFGTFIGACSAMVRRSSAPAAGFDPRIPIASDWLFFIECTARGGTIRYIDEPLGAHRRHANNVTLRRRDSSEQFLTLDIVAEKYPALANATDKGRGRLYYSDAVIAAGENRHEDAMALLGKSLALGWYSWKTGLRWTNSLVRARLSRQSSDS